MAKHGWEPQGREGLQGVPFGDELDRLPLDAPLYGFEFLGGDEDGATFAAMMAGPYPDSIHSFGDPITDRDWEAVGTECGRWLSCMLDGTFTVTVTGFPRVRLQAVPSGPSSEASQPGEAPHGPVVADRQPRS